LVILVISSTRDQLVQRYQWQNLPAADRMLFSAQCNIRGAAGETLTVHLPAFATSFFSPNRLSVFQDAFQSPIFANTRHSVPAVADILHLLQCLMPGLLTIVMVEQVPGKGTWHTSRGLPPVEWVDVNKDQLVAVFGAGHFAKLRTAASTKTMSFKAICTK
jgi:hypothetical protein